VIQDKPLIELHHEQIFDLALGAKLMGGGGGGDPYTMQLIAQEEVRTSGPVRVWSLRDVPPDALVVGVGMMGGTTVMAERLPSGEESVQVIRALERHMDRRVAALISIEMAGINSVIPVISAARLGLPLVDGDLMGRALPGIHMTLATAAGIRVTPMVIVDASGSQVILDSPDNYTAEILARSIVMDMGGAAHMAIYPMTGVQLCRVALAGSLSHRLYIGRILREARSKHRDPLLAIQRASEGVELFRGKVTTVQRQWQIGYDYAFGDASVEGAGVYMGQEMNFKFQNEYLMTAIGHHLVAMVPDNILVLEARTTDPIPPEFLVPGMDLIVLGIPCAEAWRTREGLAIIGPRAFGYEVDYRPLAVGSENRADHPC
jgi:uncharacterized protein